MKRSLPKLLHAVLFAALCSITVAHADDAKKLRIITWSDYVPAEVIAQFKQETGIQVEVSLSNNEEIISKLRATGGAGFDLALKRPSACSLNSNAHQLPLAIADIVEEYQFTTSCSSLPLASFSTLHQNLNGLAQKLSISSSDNGLLQFFNLI